MTQEYLDHLNENRWCMVRHINGKGLEVSDNPFNVLPKAIKAVHEDNPALYKDYLRFIVKDFLNPDEVEDNSLDFVFITMENIPYDTIKIYLKKLLPNGKLLTHTLVDGEWKFGMYQYDKNAIIFTDPNVLILPEKNIGIMRLGAIGDLFQVASVTHALKKQGYHVTVYAQNPSSVVLDNNPSIDQIVSTDREIVRNSELRMYWDWLAKKHTKFVNLCGSVEDAWLPNKDSPRFYWPTKIRNKLLNYNYVQFQHELCEAPYKLNVKFYPTPEEIKWADEERAKMKGKKLICYALNGSSVHKVWPHLDALIARTMLLLPDVDFVTLGDDRARLLEGGWQEESRVHMRAGEWTIRQSLTFIQRHADMLIGPETGLLNAMCTEKMKKIIFLSHSSINNLTRDWINTISLSNPYDDGSMHRLHLWDDGFTYIEKDEETGVAKSQALITIDQVWTHVSRALK